MCAITGEPINAGAQQEVCFGVRRCAEQLEDVALAISNVHAACCVTQ